jgi:hypothetical protein
MRRVTGRLMTGVLSLLTAAPLIACGSDAQSSAPSSSVTVAHPASTAQNSDEFPCTSAFESQFPGVLMAAAATSDFATDWPPFPVELAYPVVTCTGFTEDEQVWAVSTADGVVYYFSGIVEYPSGTVDDVTVLGSVPVGG